MAHPRGPITDRQAMYKEMQRAIPGLDAMYRLVHALIASHSNEAPHVLVVRAGGGREIEELRNSGAVGTITAIDPSARNLETARAVAGARGASPQVRLHHLPDDGSKLAYLRGLRQRPASGGQFIHADVCFDESEECDRMIPAFQAYADILGVSADAVRLELDAIPNLPVLSGGRTRDLIDEAGFSEPR